MRAGRRRRRTKTTRVPTPARAVAVEGCVPTSDMKVMLAQGLLILVVWWLVRGLAFGGLLSGRNVAWAVLTATSTTAIAIWRRF
jgi:hypothetical protein